MINKVIMVNGADKRVTLVEGVIRLICRECANGTYSLDNPDNCYNNSGNNIGTLEEVTQIVDALEQWEGGPDKTLEINLLNHQVKFHMDDGGDRYLIIGCTAILLADAKAVLTGLCRLT